MNSKIKALKVELIEDDEMGYLQMGNNKIGCSRIGNNKTMNWQHRLEMAEDSGVCLPRNGQMGYG